MDENKIALVKPLLRGRIHFVGFYLFLVAGIFLLINSESREIIYRSIYVFCTLYLLAISSIYHQFNWKEKTRKILQRFDHAGILLLIAGTTTPMIASTTSEKFRALFLIIYWGIMIMAVGKVIFIKRKSKWSSVIFYIVIAAFPMIFFYIQKESMTDSTLALLLTGGAAYIVGAAIYAFKKPNLFKNVFGYHELFHFFVMLGISVHFIAVCFLVIK